LVCDTVSGHHPSCWLLFKAQCFGDWILPPSSGDKDRDWLFLSLKKFKEELKLNLRPTVSRPVFLGVRHSSGTRGQFFFLLEISFRHLRGYSVASSLTRGRVCNLLVQLLLGLARAVTLGSKFRRTHGHILLSHLSLPQPGGPGSHIYIPQEEDGPGFPFVASYDSQGYSDGILERKQTIMSLPVDLSLF
jgi:hypothetical protein